MFGGTGRKLDIMSRHARQQPSAKFNTGKQLKIFRADFEAHLQAAQLRYVDYRLDIRDLPKSYLANSVKPRDILEEHFFRSPQIDSLIEADEMTALFILKQLFHRSLVHHMEYMSLEQAEQLAGRFADFFPSDASYFTNCEWDTTSGNIGWSNPITASLLDAGVACVGGGRMGYFWIEEDD